MKTAFRLSSFWALVAALCFGFFVTLQHLNAQATTLLPIEGVVEASVGKDSDVIFILNGDRTISAYDVSESKFLFTRVSLNARTGDEVQHVEASPNGDHFALTWRNRNNMYFVSTYSTAAVTQNNTEAVTTHTLGPAPDQGYIFTTFSSDGNTLYQLVGPGVLMQLSVTDDETKTLFVGDNPIKVIEGTDGRRYVLNEKSETVSIIQADALLVSEVIPVGVSPSDILFNEVTNKLYVSNIGSNSVTVIDSQDTTNHIELGVGGDPTSLSYDSVTGDVFVTNNSDGSLSIIAPDSTVSTVDLGIAAYFKSAAIESYYDQTTQKLYLLNTSESNYVIYDSSSSEVSEPVDTASFPLNIFGVNSSSDIFYYHWGANSINRIDPSTGENTYISDTESPKQLYFSKPQSIAVDEASNRFFVSNLGADYVTVIDGETFEPIKKLTVGRTIQNLFIHTGLGKLYAVSPSDNTVTAIEINNQYQMKTIPLAEQSRGGAINEVTNRIYYSNARAGSMSVVDAITDEVVAEIEFDENSFPLVSSVDEGRNLIYLSLYGADAIVVIDGNTNEVIDQIKTGPNPIWVRYIPAVDKLLATVESANEVLVINPNDLTDIKRININGEPYRIFFDDKTQHVYINRRSEDLVTELALNQAGDFEVVNTRPMKYWGETDARPYNMVAANRTTGYALFTSGKANEVVVTKINYDENDTISTEWIATIASDGTLLYPEDDDDPEPTPVVNEEEVTTLPVVTIALFAIPIALVLTLLALFFYVRKRPVTVSIDEQQPSPDQNDANDNTSV